MPMNFSKILFVAASTAAISFLAGCEGRGAAGGDGKAMARIGNETFTHSDFELLLSTMPGDRKNEILKDEDQKRKQFQQLLKQRLFSLAAQEEGFGKRESMKRRLNLVDQRIVTQAYFQTFLSEQGGLQLEDIEAFYKNNPKLFADDSGKPKLFELVKQQVADSILLRRANLDSFYTTNRRKYMERAFCEVSVLQVKTRKQAESISAEIDKGLSFSDAVTKYSIHSSKANQGKIGRAYPGETMWDLGTSVNVDSLLFAEDTRLKPHGVSKPFPKDNEWILVRSDSCVAERVPTLDGIRRQVGEEYLTNYRTRLNDSALAQLRVLYGVKARDYRNNVEESQLSAYYEKNKDSYVSPETYEIDHIEVTKKDAVEKRLKSVKDAASFRKLAKLVSENAWTKSLEGSAGWLKRDHSLPYGIGVLPAVWSLLDTAKAGSIVGPIQNPETQRWHWFLLLNKAPGKVKPMDRVKAQVTKDYLDELVAQIKPEDTLATYDKNKIIRESDVLFLREEIPPHMQERYTREALVDYLLTWELATRESDKMGLTKQAKLQAQRLENIDNYWAGIYQDSILARTYAMDSNEIKTTFAAQRKFFTRDSAEKRR